MAYPEIILIIRRIKIIFKVSLKSLFFNNTKSPNPALAKSPLIAVPKVTDPFISIIVIPIETAQLGINPTNAATAGCTNFEEVPVKSPPR